MRQTFIALMFITFGFALVRQVHADCNHSTGRTENYFPGFRVALTPSTGCNDYAFFFLAEGGQNNYRFNGTGGYCLSPCSRFKVGGEFLAQRLAFNFMNGKTHRWMQQWAGGIDYQWLLCHEYIASVDFGFEYASARRYKLPSHVCSNGQSVNRRIAGGVYYDFSCGLTLLPWRGATLSLEGNYDVLRNRRKYQPSKEHRGFGGSVFFSQRFTENLGFTLKGEMRRPYDYIEGKICWTSCSSCVNYNVSLFGSRTWGQEQLANVTACGIEVGFDLSPKNLEAPDCRDFWGDPVVYWNSPCEPCDNDLAAWVSIPAVYIPEVFAIADQNKPCNSPTSTTIQSQVLDNFQTTAFSLDLSQYFTANGPALTYSATITSSNSGGPLYSLFQVNPTTGFLLLIDDSGTSGSGETLTITATGTNTCGSTSQTFTVQVF